MGQVLLGASYLSFFFLPFLILVPVCAPIALHWKNPSRIVVFRRFNQPGLNAALRRVLAASVARYGHVFTLADDSFKITWWIRFPVLLGHLGFFHFRQRRIRTTKGLERLRADLGKRAVLSMNWLMSWRKIFAIECEDRLWQSAVSVLLEDAHLVIIDVSRHTGALVWELQECARRELLDRVVLIARGGADNDATLAWLEPALGAAYCPLPTFVYGDRRGLLEPDRFAQSVVRILASRWSPEADPAWPALGRGVARTFGGMAVVMLAALLVVLPYVSPRIAGADSPLTWQVREAYLVGKDAVAGHRLENDLREETRNWLFAHSDTRSPRANVLLDHVAEPRDVRLLIALVDDDTALSDGAFRALQRIQPAGLDLAAARWITGAHQSAREHGLAIFHAKPSVGMLDPLLNGLPYASDFAGDRQLMGADP
jgi:hypothetical protein